MKRMVQILKLLVVGGLLMAPSLVSAQDKDVHVYVTQVSLSGKTAYRYRVVNHTSQRVVAVDVGYDYPHGVYALATLPLGWTRDAGIPIGNAIAPTGWNATLITTEETEVENILEWRSGGANYDILPGQTKSGFSVTTGAPANDYHNNIWAVIFGGPSSTSANLALSGRLEDDPNPDLDTTPPSLTVKATPATLWPPDHKIVRITVDIQVSDDRDPNPVVKLVSVTSNEVLADGDITGVVLGTDARQIFVRAERTGGQKQGRIYTLRYSATDASGNTSIAETVVTVPHDQGK
jgi:hypothetical protein